MHSIYSLTQYCVCVPAILSRHLPGNLSQQDDYEFNECLTLLWPGSPVG